MSRLLRFFSLLFLICLVIFIYFIFLAEQEQETWLINEDILIPTGEQEKISHGNYNKIKTAYLSFFGILILLYLKIIWKLITLKWGISEEREGKRRMLG